MLLKLVGSVLFSLVISTATYGQNDIGQTDAERQADSLLRNFLNEKGTDPRFEEGVDTARLRQAEDDYMKNFLKLERDPKKELLHKRVLQISIGLTLLTGLFIIYRRRRK